MTEQDLPLPIGHFVTLDSGLRLHFLDEGSGPVVLWLHGSGPGDVFIGVDIIRRG